MYKQTRMCLSAVRECCRNPSLMVHLLRHSKTMVDLIFRDRALTELLKLMQPNKMCALWKHSMSIMSRSLFFFFKALFLDCFPIELWEGPSFPQLQQSISLWFLTDWGQLNGKKGLRRETHEFTAENYLSVWDLFLSLDRVPLRWKGPMMEFCPDGNDCWKMSMEIWRITCHSRVPVQQLREICEGHVLSSSSRRWGNIFGKNGVQFSPRYKKDLKKPWRHSGGWQSRSYQNAWDSVYFHPSSAHDLRPVPVFINVAQMKISETRHLTLVWDSQLPRAQRDPLQNISIVIDFSR